ncbi:MAG TPA: Bax inhibitor-1/YccA family protein [Verrucomicrobia bacterium]|nr:Bax inhibitor-1/YccA family protein [Verrucomicrobiales bacterium]HIL56076.1 Bax inhibitor-1/YccA family protein [Verrucomicrobiota bacterium]
MRSSNPALNDNTFTRNLSYSEESRMTLMGAVNKTAILLCVLVLAASITWKMVLTGESGAGIFIWGGAIAGFIVAIVTVFKKNWAPFTAPLYAALKGLFIGGISAYFAALYEGIVMQAAGLTFGILFALLAAYKSGLIKATENFKLGVCAATGGIALFYLMSIVLGLFGVNMTFLHDSSPLSIGISVFIVIIASLNLVLDFDFIENGAEAGAPKYMEWFAAFGLMVTLIWLYIEILHLLAKLRGRN